MKHLIPLLLILFLAGCEVFEANYQFKEFDTITAYEKEGTELYLAVYALDSIRWFDKVRIVEKENRIIIQVSYTISDPKSEFVRNTEGNFIQKVLSDEKLSGKELFYQDDTGLHQIDIKKWKDDLLEPYVVPEFSDPFEPLEADPAATGQRR